VALHWYGSMSWLQATFRCVQLVGWHAADTGEALPRATPTGDVVATVASDSMRLGGLYDVTTRFVGAVLSCVVVAAFLLSASVRLGLVVLIGVPVLVSLLAFIVRPLHQRQAHQREESGMLIGLGADTVAGLRVLRGIGGERTFLRRYAEQSQHVRAVGYRVAGFQAALHAAEVLLPGVFVLLVMWIGARLALAGEITPGELIAFYGYSAFLVIPLRTASEFLDRFTRAYIGARKIIRVLAVSPDADLPPPPDRSTPSPPPARMPSPVPSRPCPPPLWEALTDERSGLAVQAGELLAVVSAEPEQAVALADRLGRFGRDGQGVRLDGIPLAELAVETVRRRVVVSESDPRLFTGTVRDELDPWGHRTDEDILTALTVASGEDILETIADGLDGEVEERGRSFSGGQRQRLALTRALLSDAEILVLLEPTSAVDAHTEARIAARLTAARKGRTTVIMSVSPLVLDRADRVVLLEDGVVTAQGTHHQLIHEHPAYRAVVVRGEGD
jgi:ABC-type multidrug transport system fused ATPase/permease subunit